MSQIIIGLMGPRDKATELDINRAYKIGQLIARENWILPRQKRSRRRRGKR